MLNRLAVTILLSFAFLSGLFSADEAAKPRPPEALFQQAWYQEMAESRFEDALGIYRTLSQRSDLPATLRARAIFRTGVCLRKLGKTAEAAKVFERVVQEFPDSDVADDARRADIKSVIAYDAIRHTPALDPRV